MINFILIVTTLLGHFLYVYLLEKKKPSFALLFKTIAAISFVTIGVVNINIPPEKFKTWFIYAFIMDAIGDIFLGLRNILPNSAMFELGSMSFLLGHFLFLYGILKNVNQLLCISITLLLVVCYTVLYLNKLTISKGRKIFAIIYIFSVLLIMISSVYYHCIWNKQTSFLRMTGTFLFACSDLVLIDYNFRKKGKKKHYLYSCLYFVGQILIGLSLR